MTIEKFKKYKLINDIINDEISIVIDSNIEFIANSDGFTQYELKALQRILTYDLKNAYNLQERLESIKNLGRDSSSLNSYIVRFGENEGKIRFIKKSKDSSKGSTKESYIKKYGELNGLEKYRKDRSGVGLDTMIERYGEDEGSKKWDSYLSRFKKSHSIDGYVEKFGKEEGERLYKIKSEKYKLTNSLDGYIIKYGEDEGTKKWNELINKRAAKLTKEYIRNTYSESDYNKIIKKRFGHTSLNSFKKRFGETEGEIRYNNFIENLSYKLSLEYLYNSMDKNDADRIREERRIKHNTTKFNNGSFSTSNYSIISQDLFWILYENMEDRTTLKFYTYNKEFYLYDKDLKNVYVYDFRYKNKIIEFNGDYYHCNPLIYAPDYYNKKKEMSADMIWKSDNIKINSAKKYGFDVLIVWQKEFIDNPESIIKKCLKFLKDE
jgi:hypothetical protein